MGKAEKIRKQIESFRSLPIIQSFYLQQFILMSACNDEFSVSFEAISKIVD
jgi:hypothetical protein